MTWYAVAEDRAWDGSTPGELAKARNWTLSRDPEATGWSTDGGYDGYGMTRALAQFFADAANRAEAEGVLAPAEGGGE